MLYSLRPIRLPFLQSFLLPLFGIVYGGPISCRRHTPAEILTPDRLAAVFGFRMRLETIEGKPFALHQLWYPAGMYDNVLLRACGHILPSMTNS